VGSPSDKLVMVVGRQFITLTVHICIQYSGHEAPLRVGLSAAAYAKLWWSLDLKEGYLTLMMLLLEVGFIIWLFFMVRLSLV